MARRTRIQYEGATYHILSKGNNNQHIFAEDKQKAYFLNVLIRGIHQYNVDLFSYCIMGNHYHLLLSTPDKNLSQFMHFLGSTYASYLQGKEDYNGHIFAGRYKSLCVEYNEYLLALTRYIHLNPVRADIVEFPEQYEWSSYKFFLEERENYSWLKKAIILQQFGPTIENSAKKYREFVEAGMQDERHMFEVEKFTKAIFSCEESMERIFLSRMNLDDLYRGVLYYYRLSDLKGKSGRAAGGVKRGRQAFIYLAKEYTGASNKEIGEKAGGLSLSGVTHQFQRLSTLLKSGHVSCEVVKKDMEIIKSMVGNDPKIELGA